MRPLLFCLLFLALGTAGWWASSSFDRAGFIWLDTTTTDTTPTTTTTPTDSTPTGTTTITSTDTTPTTTITSTDTTPTITTPTTTVINPPSFANVPQNVSVEANGPSGSVVNYTAPTAVDDQGGPLPVTCSPGPGSTFALGDSTVTCTATDSGGNQGQAAFTVSVRDTTPPTLVLPAPHSVFATSALGISDSDPAVIAFVGAARATDIVDPAPVVGSDLHSFLPLGAPVMRFFARDLSGNDMTRD